MSRQGWSITPRVAKFSTTILFIYTAPGGKV